MMCIIICVVIINLSLSSSLRCGKGQRTGRATEASEGEGRPRTHEEARRNPRGPEEGTRVPEEAGGRKTEEARRDEEKGGESQEPG